MDFRLSVTAFATRSAVVLIRGAKSWTKVEANTLPVLAFQERPVD